MVNTARGGAEQLFDPFGGQIGGGDSQLLGAAPESSHHLADKAQRRRARDGAANL
jgi:hypothetical protein